MNGKKLLAISMRQGIGSQCIVAGATISLERLESEHPALNAVFSAQIMPSGHRQARATNTMVEATCLVILLDTLLAGCEAEQGKCSKQIGQEIVWSCWSASSSSAKHKLCSSIMACPSSTLHLHFARKQVLAAAELMPAWCEWCSQQPMLVSTSQHMHAQPRHACSHAMSCQQVVLTPNNGPNS